MWGMGLAWRMPLWVSGFLLGDRSSALVKDCGGGGSWKGNSLTVDSDFVGILERSSLGACVEETGRKNLHSCPSPTEVPRTAECFQGTGFGIDR